VGNLQPEKAFNSQRSIVTLQLAGKEHERRNNSNVSAVITKGQTMNPKMEFMKMTNEDYKACGLVDLVSHHTEERTDIVNERLREVLTNGQLESVMGKRFRINDYSLRGIEGKATFTTAKDLSNFTGLGDTNSKIILRDLEIDLLAEPVEGVGTRFVGPLPYEIVITQTNFLGGFGDSFTVYQLGSGGAKEIPKHQVKVVKHPVSIAVESSNSIKWQRCLPKSFPPDKELVRVLRVIAIDVNGYLMGVGGHDAYLYPQKIKSGLAAKDLKELLEKKLGPTDSLRTIIKDAYGAVIRQADVSIRLHRLSREDDRWLKKLASLKLHSGYLQVRAGIPSMGHAGSYFLDQQDDCPMECTLEVYLKPQVALRYVYGPKSEDSSQSVSVTRAASHVEPIKSDGRPAPQVKRKVKKKNGKKVFAGSASRKQNPKSVSPRVRRSKKPK
jgi:hypothetical protein